MTASIPPVELAAAEALGLRVDPAVFGPLIAEHDAIGELQRKMDDAVPGRLDGRNRVGAVGWVLEQQRRLITRVALDADAIVIVEAKVAGRDLVEQVPVAEVHLLHLAGWVILRLTPVAPAEAIFAFAWAMTTDGAITWEARASDISGAANLLTSARWTVQRWHDSGGRRMLGDVVAGGLTAGGGKEESRARNYSRRFRNPARVREIDLGAAWEYLDDQVRRQTDNGRLLHSWAITATGGGGRVVVAVGTLRAPINDPGDRHMRLRTKITANRARALSGRTRLDARGSALRTVRLSRSDKGADIEVDDGDGNAEKWAQSFGPRDVFSDKLSKTLPRGWGRMVKGDGTITLDQYRAATDRQHAALLHAMHGYRGSRHRHPYADHVGNLGAALGDRAISVEQAIEATRSPAELSASRCIVAPRPPVVALWSFGTIRVERHPMDRREDPVALVTTAEAHAHFATLRRDSRMSGRPAVAQRGPGERLCSSCYLIVPAWHFDGGVCSDCAGHLPPVTRPQRRTLYFVRRLVETEGDIDPALRLVVEDRRRVGLTAREIKVTGLREMGLPLEQIGEAVGLSASSTRRALTSGRKKFKK